MTRRARSLGYRQERPEVGVTGHDDSAITLSEQQELDVFGSLEAEFKGVHSIMSVFAE